MEFYEVVVKRYHRHEAYHDVIGYEVEIRRTEKEFESWTDQEWELKNAKLYMQEVINALKKLGYEDEEIVSNNKKRAVMWCSTGD